MQVQLQNICNKTFYCGDQLKSGFAIRLLSPIGGRDISVVGFDLH